MHKTWTSARACSWHCAAALFVFVVLLLPLSPAVRSFDIAAVAARDRTPALRRRRTLVRAMWHA